MVLRLKGSKYISKIFKGTTLNFSSQTFGNVYDVVIIGGGMVGASLAAALGNNKMTSELKIAIVDQKTPVDRVDKPLEEYPELRVSTLTPRSIEFLKECKAWKFMRPPKSAYFHKMQVWDYNTSGCLQWSSDDIGSSEMGAIVENSLVQSACLKAAEQNPNIDFLFSSTLESLKVPLSTHEKHISEHDLVDICLKDMNTLKAKLIVGADGAMSKVREMCGMRMVGWNYDQQGLVATVAVDDISDEKIAWQRFLPTGPLALLPVRDSLYNIVWTVTNDMANKLKQAKENNFIQAINEALHGVPPSDKSLSIRAILDIPQNFMTPPNVTAIKGSAPMSFPLKLMYTGNYISSRLALIGDAAHVIHPLAGQGVNLGLGDAEQLAKALSEAVRTGTDIGNEQMLQRDYESIRKITNNSMMIALEGIKRVFDSQLLSTFNIRGLGMDIINISGPLKNEIMKHAMGIKSVEDKLKFFV